MQSQEQIRFIILQRQQTQQ